MWNEDIPIAFRYQPNYYVYSFLFKYSHTLPKDAVLLLYCLEHSQLRFSSWYMETTPAQDTPYWADAFNTWGLQIKIGVPSVVGTYEMQIIGMVRMFTPADRSWVVYYYNEALKKISRILQGFDINVEPTRKTLRELNNYSTITARATNFLSSTVNYKLDQIRNVINTAKIAGFDSQPSVFPRLKNISRKFTLKY